MHMLMDVYQRLDVQLHMQMNPYCPIKCQKTNNWTEVVIECGLYHNRASYSTEHIFYLQDFLRVPTE